jgi:hypothetical protein
MQTNGYANVLMELPFSMKTVKDTWLEMLVGNESDAGAFQRAKPIADVLR